MTLKKDMNVVKDNMNIGLKELRKSLIMNLCTKKQILLICDLSLKDMA
jgi:hypothetical protein